MTHAVASSGGVELAVHDLGGDGPPLLICHATGFCGRTYEPLAVHLTGHHHVWALDVRGHGESGRPDDGDFDWSGAADDVAAVAAWLGTRDGGAPLHAVGHSMGGASILRAEARRPGTFASAYVFEPIVPPTAWSGGDLPNPMADAARRRRAEFPTRDAALWRYASRTALGTLQASCLAAYVEHGFADLDDGTVRLRCDPADEAATFQASSTGVHAGDLEDVDVPTVVAFGTAESSHPARFAPPLVEALRDAVLERHEHLGHFGPLEDPATIAACILRHTRGR